VTDAELRALLVDCVALWGVSGSVAVAPGAAEISTPAGRFVLRHAAPTDGPVRWFLHTPDRETAKRGPRALPSIVAVLSALRRESIGC
jgi:hypothetical protein